MTTPTPPESRHTIASQGYDELLPIKDGGKPQRVPVIDCSCGWHGEVHVWAHHVQSEAHHG
jgi:hypothetical protein